ncbi:MAG: hypothetical protein ABIP29_02580 [Candidatus Eisenbacteria bacterium]
MRLPTLILRRIARAAARCVLTLAVAGLPGLAGAAVSPGSVAPNFTKNEVGAPAPAARSLSDYSGKVVVLFLLGYS